MSRYYNYAVTYLVDNEKKETKFNQASCQFVHFLLLMYLIYNLKNTMTRAFRNQNRIVLLSLRIRAHV